MLLRQETPADLFALDAGGSKFRCVMRISIVIDCQDPDRLRTFWEAALDYELSATLPGYRVLAPASNPRSSPC